jgi:hypothetical protein
MGRLAIIYDDDSTFVAVPMWRLWHVLNACIALEPPAKDRCGALSPVLSPGPQ